MGSGIVFALILFQCLLLTDAFILNRGTVSISNAQLKIGRSPLPHLNAAQPRLIEPLGKGINEDVKRKLKTLPSDIKDGFSIKTLSSTFFLYFACLAPAVAFGGLLALSTGGLMGTTEAVGATALGGFLYAAFSGQPITIIGTTGPLLAFLKVLYSTCASKGIPFLPVYAWTGLWSSFFLLLSSLFSTSNVVEYLTKFTDDIFSSLISIIFIFEAVVELHKNFANPAISGIQATAALISALTTYTTATVLAKVRRTNLFPRKVRGLISDFAPTLGVMAGTCVAYAAMGRYGFALPTLGVPEILGTTSGRPWLVDLFSISNNIKLLTFFPALMATILLFMDQNITVRLVMAKKNKLKKGSGIHLDMFVISAITAITSVLGMPWMVAATVRSVAHLRSLNKFETVTTQDTSDSSEGSDEVTKMEFVGVQEQRVTGLLIHSCIAASLAFGRPLLRKLPVSVLTGLFLYLGTSSIGTTDLWERALLFVTDSRDAPNTSWKQKVGLNRTKIFTAIQLSLLGGMWWVKGTKLGVFFPVLIGLLAPVRIMLEKMNIFSPRELEALDGEIS